MVKKKVNITNIQVSKRERMMLIGVMLTISFLFYTMWYEQQSAKIKKLETQITQVEEKIKTESLTHTTLKMKSLNSVAKTKTNDSVPDGSVQESNMAKIVDEVVRTTRGHNFKLSRMSLVHTMIEDKVRTSTFNLEVKSSFLKLATFMEGLENSADWVAIELVDLHRFDKELEECYGTIRVKAYELLGDD